MTDTTPREWILDFAPPFRSPIVTIGRFVAMDEAQAAAEAQEGRPLVWTGPDASYAGLTAAGDHGYWLLLSEERVVPRAADPARGRPRRQSPDEQIEEATL